MANQRTKTVVDFNKAQDYLDLCNRANDAYAKKVNVVELDNYNRYEVVDRSEPTSSNFKAVLFKRGDEYIVSFFGTDIKSVKDIGTDVVMSAGKNPKQFIEAEKFVIDMMNKYNIPLEKLTAIGNSEGGSEAIHIKGLFGIKEVYTYNGYIPRLTQYSPDNLQDNIYNFRMSGDIVSKGGHVVGEDYIVPVADKCRPKWGVFGVVDWHRIKNMADCRNAIPAPVFEILNPDWKNKYMFGILTTKEIEDIPNPIYHLFEDAINNRVRDNAVIDSNRPRGDFYTNPNLLHSHEGVSNSGCAGTYQVSGYTRADGTQVPSYFRTCGAQHMG